MTPTPQKERTRRPATFAVGFLLLIAMAPLAMAQESGEPPRVEIEERPETVRNDCNSFIVHGRHIPATTGGILIFREVEGGEDELLVEDEFRGGDEEATGGGFHVSSAKYFFEPPGPYYAVITWPQDDEVRSARSEPFTVACGEAAGVWGTPPDECFDGDIRATANADGSITLVWEPYGDDDTDRPLFGIYRAEGDGNLRDLAFVRDTTFTDETAEPGKTYRYEVAQFTGHGALAPLCVEVTAIPFFPTPLLAALGLAGSLTAFAVLKRRRR